MPNSLRAKFDSMRYKGRIDEAEYQALIKKLDGHDKQIRADAIEECIDTITHSYSHYDNTIYDILNTLRQLKERNNDSNIT